MTLQISASQLSFGAQGDDVARVHQAMQVLGRRISVSETADRVLSVGVVAVLKGLQREPNLPTRGLRRSGTVNRVKEHRNRVF